MITGMRAGNFAGEVEEAAVSVRVDQDDPAERVLSWSTHHLANEGAVYKVMVDAVEVHRGTETDMTGVPQDARDHIQVIEVTEPNRDEDLSLIADSANDRVKVTWAGVS